MTKRKHKVPFQLDEEISKQALSPLRYENVSTPVSWLTSMHVTSLTLEQPHNRMKTYH